MINNTYSDFSVNFEKNNFINDLSKVIDRTSIRQSIANILLTMKGEKPFNRNFGCDVYKQLFENSSNGINSLELIKLQRNIGNQIGFYEPRVVLTNINFDESQIDSNILKISLSYIVRNMDENVGQSGEDSVSVTISKVR